MCRNDILPNTVIPAESLSGNPEKELDSRFHRKPWIPAKNMQE